MTITIFQEDSHWDVKHNQMAKGFGQASSSQNRGHSTPAKQPQQLPKVPQMAQYNSPQALYSEDNIREVLAQQTETLSSGVKG